MNRKHQTVIFCTIRTIPESAVNLKIILILFKMIYFKQNLRS